MSDKQDPTAKQIRTNAAPEVQSALLKAERKAQRLARGEAWKAEVAAWQAQVATHFGYLETDYDFQFAGLKDGSHRWGIFVDYQSPWLQITIEKNFEFNGIEVDLIRLVDGQLAKDALAYDRDRINVLMTLKERAPSAYEQLRTHRGLSVEQLDSTLSLHANALRTYFDDVLHGHLTIFDEETERRRQRAMERLRQNEQE